MKHSELFLVQQMVFACITFLHTIIIQLSWSYFQLFDWTPHSSILSTFMFNLHEEVFRIIIWICDTCSLLRICQQVFWKRLYVSLKLTKYTVVWAAIKREKYISVLMFSVELDITLTSQFHLSLQSSTLAPHVSCLWQRLRVNGIIKINKHGLWILVIMVWHHCWAFSKPLSPMNPPQRQICKPAINPCPSELHTWCRAGPHLCHCPLESSDESIDPFR